MFVAIKDSKTTYVGASSVGDSLCDMSKQDMMLEENVTIWKIAGHKGWYAVGDRFYVEMDLLRYTKGLFAKEITYQSLLSYTIPRMKALLESRGLVKDRAWYNDLLIVSKDKAYTIDGYFCVNEVDDYAVANACMDIIRGALEYTEGLPTKVRICEAIHSVEEMRGKSHFPAILLDVATGKKECWWSYEDALAKTRDEWTDEMNELYKKALQIVIDEQKASMSLLQRKLGVGYNKAGMLIERMEEENYIEKFKGGASRKVLITQAQFDERFHG
jgi:hypothetical protein